VSKRYLVLISRGAAVLFGLLALLVWANICAYVYLRPALPDVDTLRDVQLQVPLRVYSRDGRLIASIGEQRRIPVRYEQVPKQLIEAFLAAEDDRFFSHHGLDWQGFARAALANIRSGELRQGGGTITMQVARNMFLSPERDWRRKLKEIYLSFLIESEFSKQDIFALYLNKIFLGQRAYGVAAAAEVYFGKGLDELTLAETATIAGLPRRPSGDNPVANPDAAKQRRAYVLRRMRELRYISPSEEAQANQAPMESRLHGPTIEVDAPYVAEMVRADLQAKYGDGVYTAGYRVYTTIDSRLQAAANTALRTGLLEYDRRHGWRGATAKIVLPKGSKNVDWEAELDEFPAVGGLRPAVVQKVEARSARIYVKDMGVTVLPWEKLTWARRQLPDAKTDRTPDSAKEILAPGDVIYTAGRDAGNLQFVQIPEIEGALVSIDPKDGAVAALVGGFDFFQSKFNRAVQARRQPGSAFKPFIYSAALDKGFTPASVIMDAPIVFDDPNSEEAWRPENSTNKFYGPTRLREALVRSRNLVSVRLMREMGGTYVWNYLTRFGFDKAQMPNNLTLALGTGAMSPLQLATAYSVFANGGYRVSSYYTARIEDPYGKVLEEAAPAMACYICGNNPNPGPSGAEDSSGHEAFLTALENAHGGHSLLPKNRSAPQAITPQVAFLLSDMMADVIKRGTGRRALALGRDDIAGKTGTTNDHRDTWFSGFNGDLVATVWVGFDQERSLGDGEEGGSVAVPPWNYFMHEALRGAPRHYPPHPDGLVTVRISPETGLLASADNPNAIMETFIEGNLPQDEVYDPNGDQNPLTDGDKPLF
jgi:penicillin-binding protein 1A